MSQSRALERSIPSIIITATCLHLAVGLAVLVLWKVTGKLSLITAFFNYPGALFLVGGSAAEVALSWHCWRQFEAGEPLGKAWLWITGAAACHLAGSVMGQIFGANSYLNPLVYIDPVSLRSVMELARKTGPLIGGPLEMALLARGLWYVLGVYRRSGLFSRLTRADWLLMLGLAAYTIREAWQVVAALQSGKVADTFEMIGWTSDPLLILLLAQAICIRRSVLSMGWGLIARCWGAFAAAVALTALGDIGLWANWSGYLPWPWNSITWYVWFVAAAGYVLGPAYQVEAFRQARHIVTPCLRRAA